MSYQQPADFKRITLQDIFNAAWQTFIVENQPPGVEVSEFGHAACRYLTEDGRMCAVGLVIPQGHPAQNCDGPFDDVASMYPELWHDSVLDCGFLEHFQTDLHDGLAYTGNNSTEPHWKFSLEERKERYRGIAQRYGLTIPEPRTPSEEP